MMTSNESLHFLKPIDVLLLSDREQWNTFLQEVRPPTFLHSWEWGEFQKHMGAKIVRLGLFSDTALIGVALILIIQARRGSFLFCPQGPIMRVEGRGSRVEGGIRSLIAYLRALALKEGCHFIRISPLMEDTEQNRQIFRERGFRRAPIHMHPETAWILDIRKNEDALLADMRKGTRYSIRKAQKDGVIITQSSNLADLDTFYRIYQTTVDRQHFIPFSKKYLECEFNTFQRAQNACFFFAQYHGEILASALILFDQWSAYYHHGASLLKYPKIPLAYLLQWEAIREAKKRGCQWYNFWGITQHDTISIFPFLKREHPWAGLSLFKKGFGGFDQQYVPAYDLPLNSRYWTNYIVETMRRIKRGL